MSHSDGLAGPAQSPYLNPIEHMWGNLKLEVHNSYLGIFRDNIKPGITNATETVQTCRINAHAGQGGCFC